MISLLSRQSDGIAPAIHRRGSLAAISMQSKTLAGRITYNEISESHGLRLATAWLGKASNAKESKNKGNTTLAGYSASSIESQTLDSLDA